MIDLSSILRARLSICVVGASLGLAVAAVALTPATAAGTDERTAIVLDATERDLMLAGMRTYLESIQGIVAALAENQPDRVSAIAARSGAKLLQTVSPVTATKLPLGFMSMSFDTHDKFDKLSAKAARTASRSDVLGDLRDILGNCTSCHMSYRALPTSP